MKKPHQIFKMPAPIKVILKSLSIDIFPTLIKFASKCRVSTDLIFPITFFFITNCLSLKYNKGWCAILIYLSEIKLKIYFIHILSFGFNR